MRLKAIVLTIALGAFAMASQSGIKLERKYKEGDTDAYAVAMHMSLTGGLKVDITGVYSQTVKKVYENGDADVENAMKDIVANMMGSERKQKSAAPTTMRFNKFGAPVGDTKGSQTSTFLIVASTIGDKELKVGETYPISFVDPKAPEDKVVGTIKAESIANGVATLLAKADVGQKAPSKPMHMETKALVDLASGKPTKIEGTVSGAQFQGGGPVVESMTFTFQRAH